MDELVTCSVALVKLHFSKQSVVFVELHRLQFNDVPFCASIKFSDSNFRWAAEELSASPESWGMR